MPDPVLMAIATAVASKAAEAVASGGLSAIGKLVRLVRDRFAGDNGAREALAAAERSPDDAERVSAVGAHLGRLTAADPAFAAELRELWRQAGPQLTADHGGVANQISGTVGGNVVQARDIQGGISFGPTGR